jgi:uncharacterized membrane-anchored protein YhcB (DUF1043 family)
MVVDPSVWLVGVASVVGGALLGVLFERMRGPAAKRAAKFEAELMQARSDLIHYRDQTKHHFGKSAELLGRMATDYREFLDHFVSGAEELCGPNLKELNASGLDRPMLERVAPAGTSDALPRAATAESISTTATAAAPTASPAPLGTTLHAAAPTDDGVLNGAAHRDPLPPSALGALDREPLAEEVVAR